MLDKKEMIELAAKLLNLSTDEATKYSHEIEDLGALYFSIPDKGGHSLIVDYTGEVLYANSSVSYDKHLQEFKKGTRTPLDIFKIS